MSQGVESHPSLFSYTFNSCHFVIVITDTGASSESHTVPFRASDPAGLHVIGLNPYKHPCRPQQKLVWKQSQSLVPVRRLCQRLMHRATMGMFLRHKLNRVCRCWLEVQQCILLMFFRAPTADHNPPWACVSKEQQWELNQPSLVLYIKLHYMHLAPIEYLSISVLHYGHL